MEEALISPLECSSCDRIMEQSEVYCTSCGYPQRGTEQQQSKFHAERILQMRESSDAKDRIKSARNTLFVIAALNLIWGLFYFFQSDNDIGMLITFIILAVIYVLLGYWSQQKPLVALILGLLVYLTIHVLSAIVDPETIYNGIIVKVIVLVYLGKGINSALHLRKS